ncbi:MAG: hypothetical protein SGI71_05390 [Verrucomicrobiota bacterium]|nr:hypothetical protein [Verrucomicrobiota bacterium]
MKTISKLTVVPVLACALLSSIGCEATRSGSGGPTNTAVGAVAGAAIGTAAGQAIDPKGGGWWKGAATGAAAGAAAGAIYTEHEKRSMPYGRIEGSYVRSPFSSMRVRRSSYSYGQVVYDANTGKPFRVP